MTEGKWMKRRQVLMKPPRLQHPAMVYQLAWASKLAKASFSKTIEKTPAVQLKINQTGAFKDGWKSCELE